MKHQKKIIIGGVIVILIIASATYLKSYNGRHAPQQDPDIGISDSRVITATSTSGVASTLEVRTVESKTSYYRIQADWVWVKTTYANAGWAPVVPSKGKDFVLTLNVDHTLSVKGDCNSIGGTYELSKNTVSGIETEDEMSLGEMKVSAAAMTKKYCEGSKENAFLKDFSKVYAYDMRPLQLHLVLPDNQGTMIFERKAEDQG